VSRVLPRLDLSGALRLTSTLNLLTLSQGLVLFPVTLFAGTICVSEDNGRKRLTFRRCKLLFAVSFKKGEREAIDYVGLCLVG